MDKYPQYRETSMATLEIKLPQNHAHFKKTHLDITAYELKEQIRKDYGLQDLHLIMNGRKLSLEKRLDEQNVENKSRIMVLPASIQNRKDLLEYEKKKCSADKGVQRTQRGIQILSKRQSTEGPTTSPFLEITDQEGNTLQISEIRDREALMTAMVFHEKGRALMKNRKYETAQTYLEKAEEQFKQCDPTILNALDNFAILQLDIVWCYQRLNKSYYLNKAEVRLLKAERCFQKCYGDEQKRLQQIKKHTGGENVLLLRLYLLQSCVAFHSHNKKQASDLLNKVDDLYKNLRVDPEKLKQLTSTWGFSDREARLGLRACQGNINEVVKYLTLKEKKESEWWRQHLQDVNTLVEMGYSREDAAIALRFAKGDLDAAFRILLDRAEGQTSDTIDEIGMTDSSLRLIEYLIQREKSESEKKRQHLQDINRLVEMGYSREDAAVALCYAEGDFHEASKILLDHKEGQTSDTTDEMDMTVSSLGLIGYLTKREEREGERRQHLQDIKTLVELGNSSEDAAIALLANGDLDEAFRTLLDREEGQISGITVETEEPDPSSASSRSPDEELVHEILKDIPRHVEDYLDLTLEEEQGLMIKLRSDLTNDPPEESLQVERSVTGL